MTLYAILLVCILKACIWTSEVFQAFGEGDLNDESH